MYDRAVQKSPLAAVDLNLLLALEALLAEAHVGRAGRRVGLSASAMSHALARLRSLLDDPLLVRAGRRMTLTKRAAELSTPLTDALGRIAELLEKPAVADPASERRTVRIAVSDFALNHVLPPLWPRLTKSAPNVDLVVSLFGLNGFKELADGEIDLAIAANRPTRGFQLGDEIPKAGIVVKTAIFDGQVDLPQIHRHHPTRAIWREPFVCLARRDHPALRTKMTLRRFAALEHVLVSPRGRRVGASDQALRKKGLKRRVTLVVPTFLAAANAVSVSDAVLTCGRRSAEDAKRFLSLETFRPPLSLSDGLLLLNWHERQQHDDFLVWLRDEIERAALDAQA